MASSLRRRRSPLSAGSGFFSPSDLTGPVLVRALSSLASDISSAHASPFLQRRNTLTLLRRARTLLSALLEPLRGSPRARLPPPTPLCLRELYILLYRSKSLLDCLSSASRVWLLLHTPKLASLFHDLSLESSTLLELLPIHVLPLPVDSREHLLLLREHSRASSLYVDPADESLRLGLHAFFRALREGDLPRPDDLRVLLVDRLGIRDARACRAEIEFLEDQIYTSPDDDAALDPALLDSSVALLRYARFLLFGFAPDLPASRLPVAHGRVPSFSDSGGGGGPPVPKEFCCPVSLELMRDPVVVSTGQTYDRGSIARWLEEGHNTCPNSGQVLAHKLLVPNRAIRSLIAQWCAGMGYAYDVPDTPDSADASSPAAGPPAMSRAAEVANRATTDLLVGRLESGSEAEKTVAARELRLLAKTGRENRAYIAEAGAIPFLERLLASSDEVAQENAVTAILNLSIHDRNKSKVMEVDGCLRSIVGVLRHGLTVEARENAAAALFSLSAVHEYKKLIGEEEGGLEALAGLLRDGTPRGKRDAVTALFNLSTHADCSDRMVASGAAAALVDALATEGVVEEAAGALGLLMRRPAAATTIARDGRALNALVGLMRQGSPRGRENAVAALAEMCRSGGAAVTAIVAAVPSINGLIQTLLFTGTKRARRKAASLARSFQKYEAPGGMPIGLLPIDFSLARSASLRRRMNLGGSGATGDSATSQASSFVSGGDVDVSMSVSISVPVL